LDVNRASANNWPKPKPSVRLVARDLAKERRVMLELIGFAAESAEWTVSASGSMPLAPPSTSRARSPSRLRAAAGRSCGPFGRDGATSRPLNRREEPPAGLLGWEPTSSAETDGSKSLGPVLEVGIPIFDTNAAQIAKAGSLARVALASYEAASQQAVREARTAWIDLDTASRLSEQYRATVLALSERNLTLAEARVKAGQADVTVLLDAQRELIEARRTLLDLELRWDARRDRAGAGGGRRIALEIPVSVYGRASLHGNVPLKVAPWRNRVRTLASN
jgi:hypothetical protein